MCIVSACVTTGAEKRVPAVRYIVVVLPVELRGFDEDVGWQWLINYS